MGSDCAAAYVSLLGSGHRLPGFKYGRSVPSHLAAACHGPCAEGGRVSPSLPLSSSPPRRDASLLRGGGARTRALPPGGAGSAAACCGSPEASAATAGGGAEGGDSGSGGDSDSDGVWALAAGAATTACCSARRFASRMRCTKPRTRCCSSVSDSARRSLWGAASAARPASVAGPDPPAECDPAARGCPDGCSEAADDNDGVWNRRGGARCPELPPASSTAAAAGWCVAGPAATGDSSGRFRAGGCAPGAAPRCRMPPLLLLLLTGPPCELPERAVVAAAVKVARSSASSCVSVVHTEPVAAS